MSVTDHHWVQIKKASYDTVDHLVRSPLVQRSARRLCGVEDAGTWRLTVQAGAMIRSDEILCVAGRLIQAQLNRLPSHIYRALIAGSPAFTQHEDLEALYRQVRQPPEGWNPAEFVRLLEETIRAGRRPDAQPRLVATLALYTARWQPDEMYLRQNRQGDWFLGLMFDVQHRPARRHAAPVPVGLDLGLNPLTVACAGAGEFQTFHASSLDHLRDVDRYELSDEARGLLRRLAYASGREDAQQVIAYLNWRADRVYAEKLRLPGMNLGYVQKARERAIHDHHFSYLPQGMYAAGVKFKRVPAWNTSRRCVCCYVKDNATIYGERQGHQLTCPRCKHIYNCHEVAAWNVRVTGEEVHGPLRRR